MDGHDPCEALYLGNRALQQSEVSSVAVRVVAGKRVATGAGALEDAGAGRVLCEPRRVWAGVTTATASA